MLDSALAAIPTGARGAGWLGKYQLIRRLATGGMAELFLARTSAIHGFEKSVVLKRILPQHAESDDFIRMFLAEAKLAATLHHPNIVQVYDIGEDNETYFFTMEYVQGQDLRRLVRAARKKQQPIPLEHILHAIMGIAGGLHHAHEKVGPDGRHLGIVHRDVSPSNVLVTYEGDVKIVDFGIAKAATAQVSTIAGTLKGKIPYMSPEQCRGESVDRRSDIFSIGTLLWELTTGRRLFAGDNEFAILNRVAKGDVPLPSSIRPEYPPELEAIVMRALQANPDDRYATAVDLQIDLEDFSREARLPVSSARLGRFMRSLFSEELEKARAEVVAERTRVEAAALGGATIIVPPSSPPDGLPGVDLTPSELRNFGADPTPGIVGDSSGTDIALPPVRKRISTGSIIAIGAGFVATLGVAAFMYNSGEPTPAAAVDPPGSPVQLLESKVEPDPDERAAAPSAPTPVPAAAEAGIEIIAGDPALGVGVPAPSEDHVGAPPGPRAVDSSGAEVPDPQSEAPTEDEDEVDPADDDDSEASTKKPRPRNPKKQPPKPVPAATQKPPKPPKNDRPKYDPNQALPPGMSFGGGKK